MSRLITFIYGMTAYVIFLVTFLYSIGFVGNLLVPKSIDSGVQRSIATSVMINLAQLCIFALQHSIMARTAFKRGWSKVIPKAAERSTYILMTCFALIAIFMFWQPLATPIWDFSDTATGTVLSALFWVGWLVGLASTFMIDHFDLLGLRQIYPNLKNRNAIRIHQSRSLQVGPPSHYDRISDRLLGRAEHVCQASLIHVGDHRLHRHRRATSRRERLGCPSWR